jgi:molecular chaperone DnaK (HSP70)
MNSITAAFLGWRFLSEPGQLGELLVVVDAGDSGTTAAIARNTDGELRILGRESDPTISGFRFTGLFAQTLLAKAGEKYGIGIQAVTARARQRFLAEVRKAKENLTVNPKIRFQCTALFEGIDAVLEVTRDDLLAVVGPSLRNLSQLFAVLLRNAGVQKRAITNVLLVGGGSRLWSFQDHVVNFFKRKPQGVPAVTECIAMGLTQANAGNCKVVDILSSRIEYMLNERDRFSLFDPGTELSTRKRVSVTVARGSRVVFRTDTEQIGSLTINATGNDNQVEFIACINASGLLTVAVLPPSNGKYTAIYNAADRYQEMERQEVVFCELDAIGEARSELQAVHSELDQALMGSMLPFFDRAEFARATGLRESVSLLLEASIAGKTVHDYQSRVTEIRQLLESAKNRRRAQASFR